MLKALNAALLALSLIFPGRADAQAQPDPDAVAAAMELITTLRVTDQFKLTLPAALQALKPVVSQGRPETERDFDAVASVVLDAMKIRVSELLGQVAAVYARTFTVSEMRQMVAFYRTPAGQKFLDKSIFFGDDPASRTIQMLARPTALQEQAFALLGVPLPRVQ